MGSAEKRYKEKCAMRPRSREDHFNSDQEYDYWPPTERGRRESGGGYEQRSQTLHSRRSSKCKKGQERSYSQKSPFEDDFASHALSFGADFKTQGGESDASETNVRKKSPINPSRLFTYTDAFPRRRDQPSNDIRPADIVPSSPLESRESPREDSVRSRTSRGSCNRQSPFEDDFTPPETRPTIGRPASSVSSDLSDRRSPYRVPSVAEESENAENANGRFGDDVFLPAEDGDVGFADFENDAFPAGPSEFVPSKPMAESRRLDRRVGWSSEEGKKSEKCIPLTKTRIGSLRCDPANIKKSESVNIFRRENDPFDDDFFGGDARQSSEKPRPRPDHLRTTDKSNNNGDPFKWTKAFESFNFDEEQ